MKISTEKTSYKENLVESLIGIGYSKEKAINIYQKYSKSGRTDILKDYIDSKKSISKYKPRTTMIDA